MRMRKKKNLVPRMERCSDLLIHEPYGMPGKWRTLMPNAREIRLELGCGKGPLHRGDGRGGAGRAVHRPGNGAGRHGGGHGSGA